MAPKPKSTPKKRPPTALDFYMLARRKLQESSEEDMIRTIFLEHQMKELESDKQVRYALNVAEQMREFEEHKKAKQEAIDLENKKTRDYYATLGSSKLVVPNEPKRRRATEKMSPLVPVKTSCEPRGLRSIDVTYLRELLIEIERENKEEMEQQERKFH